MTADRYIIMSQVAEAYYLAGKTQQQIAKELCIDRSSVSRLLTEARDCGIVEIKIHRAFGRDENLEAELAAAFPRCRIGVVTLPNLPPLEAIGELGKFAAQSIHDMLRPGMVIGLTLGASLRATVTALAGLSPLAVTVVQLCGSIGSGDSALDAYALSQDLARAYSSPAVNFHAPFLVESEAMRESLRANASNRRCLELARKCDLAVVGSTSVDMNHSSLFIGGHISENTVKQLLSYGVIGDVAGFYFNAAGEVVDYDASAYLTGISFQEFMAVPKRICVAMGDHKAPVLAVAMAKGLITDLFTDHQTAVCMLELAKKSAAIG